MSQPTGDAEGAALAAELAARGARRLQAVFMFPVLSGGKRQWCHYASVEDVRWRQQRADFYVRCAATPFEIVPLRPTDPDREGVWYSLGPGRLSTDAPDIGEVLLLQVEGAPTGALADGREWERLLAGRCEVAASEATPAEDRRPASHRIAAVVERPSR